MSGAAKAAWVEQTTNLQMVLGYKETCAGAQRIGAKSRFPRLASQS